MKFRTCHFYFQSATYWRDASSEKKNPFLFRLTGHFDSVTMFLGGIVSDGIIMRPRSYSCFDMYCLENDDDEPYSPEDDEPYSPGALDDEHDTQSSLDLQREMELLNRKIEEQKQQIESISSSLPQVMLLIISCSLMIY